MMPEQYILDTNVLVALIDSSDIFHDRATRLMERIRLNEGEAYLSDAVLNETLSVLAKRCEARGRQRFFNDLAARFRSQIRDKPILCLYELLPNHFKSFQEIMTQSEGRLNFHDSMIVFFLRQLPEVILATFDKDFSEVGTIQIAEA